MTREFKCRAWNKCLEKMTTPFDFSNIESDAGYGGIYNPKMDLNFEVVVYQLHEAEKYVLMQYTGLKDKNGKEIYEGDILNISGIGIARVVWGAYSWNYTNEEHYGSFEDLVMENETIEVIGNIYEPKELLERD